MAKTRKRYRQLVEIVNPQLGMPDTISYSRALEHCASGIASWTKDGQLRFRTSERFNPRQGSDIYVDGDFEFRKVHTPVSKVAGAPRMPIIKWEHIPKDIKLLRNKKQEIHAT